MLSVVLDQQTIQKLLGEDVVLIQDETGKTVGRFIAEPRQPIPKLRISEEEIARRSEEAKRDPGRSLADILRDLEKAS